MWALISAIPFESTDDVKSSYLLKMLFPYEEPHAYIYT